MGDLLCRKESNAPPKIYISQRSHHHRQPKMKSYQFALTFLNGNYRKFPGIVTAANAEAAWKEIFRQMLHVEFENVQSIHLTDVKDL